MVSKGTNPYLANNEVLHLRQEDLFQQGHAISAGSVRRIRKIISCLPGYYPAINGTEWYRGYVSIAMYMKGMRFRSIMHPIDR